MPAILAAALISCTKQPASQPPPPDASPVPQATATPAQSPAPTTPGNMPGAKPTPAQEEKKADEEEMGAPDDTPQAAAKLQHDYFSTTDADKREEYIGDLEQMTIPEAIQAITQIIPAETDPSLKAHLVSVLSDSDATPEQKLGTLAPLIMPGQPDEVRESALNGLETVDDPRAIPVWQRLLNDTDDTVKQRAEDAIERLK